MRHGSTRCRRPGNSWAPRRPAPPTTAGAPPRDGYDLTLSDRSTYTRYKFFRGHFDLATSQGLNIDRVETLPRGTSDHMPILVNATYRDALRPQIA